MENRSRRSVRLSRQSGPGPAETPPAGRKRLYAAGSGELFVRVCWAIVSAWRSLLRFIDATKNKDCACEYMSIYLSCQCEITHKRISSSLTREVGRNGQRAKVEAHEPECGNQPARCI